MPIPPNAWSTLKEGLLFGDRYGKKLGFETTSPNCFFEREDSRNSLDEEVVAKFKSAVDVDINALVQQRLEAKQNKDYTESDRIRDELQAVAIAVAFLTSDRSGFWLAIAYLSNLLVILRLCFRSANFGFMRERQKL